MILRKTYDVMAWLSIHLIACASSSSATAITLLHRVSFNCLQSSQCEAYKIYIANYKENTVTIGIYKTQQFIINQDLLNYKIYKTQQQSGEDQQVMGKE
jgi:sulfur relay (sulfurtransferase) DsrF/TusC family protein